MEDSESAEPVIARCLLASAVKRQSRLTGHVQNLWKSGVDVWKSAAELRSLNATRNQSLGEAADVLLRNGNDPPLCLRTGYLNIGAYEHNGFLNLKVFVSALITACICG
jgi:hypothetical protein